VIHRYFGGRGLIQHPANEAAVAGRRRDCDAPLTGRRLRHAYTLLEVLPDGSLLRETFPAPDNTKAIARAQEVVEGDAAELWRHQTLICCWRPGRASDSPERDVLRTYSLYFFTPAGRFVRRDVFSARDDREALEKAQRPGEQCVTELWCGAARVGMPRATEGAGGFGARASEAYE